MFNHCNFAQSHFLRDRASKQIVLSNTTCDASVRQDILQTLGRDAESEADYVNLFWQLPNLYPSRYQRMFLSRK